eukprot:scaffold166335_cov14-Tisochrysis_lutea.AAC.1
MDATLQLLLAGCVEGRLLGLPHTQAQAQPHPRSALSSGHSSMGGAGRTGGGAFVVLDQVCRAGDRLLGLAEVQALPEPLAEVQALPERTAFWCKSIAPLLTAEGCILVQ